MGAIADRVSKQPGGGKALLFEKPLGKTIPVAMNAFGGLRRMEMALGVDREPRSGDEGRVWIRSWGWAAPARYRWRAPSCRSSATVGRLRPTRPMLPGWRCAMRSRGGSEEQIAAGRDL